MRKGIVGPSFCMGKQRTSGSLTFYLARVSVKTRQLEHWPASLWQPSDLISGSAEPWPGRSGPLVPQWNHKGVSVSDGCSVGGTDAVDSGVLGPFPCGCVIPQHWFTPPWCHFEALPNAHLEAGGNKTGLGLTELGD